MDTAVMDSHLTWAVSCLESDAAGNKVDEVVAELRSCEHELVAHRFVRSLRSDGTPVRVRVAAADAALIHVSRALNLMMNDRSHLDQAIESIEHARLEIAHMPQIG